MYDDEAPIAQVTKGTTDTLVHLHPDQLGTPRIATDAARSTVWRHDGNAFGDTLPNEDPDGNAKKTTVNLRFPGQYYDAETKLHYNWHRYYDPRIGRYVTSDPIGLEGGLNTYAYVDNNPTGWIDFDGLSKTRGGGNNRSTPRPEQGGTTWWNGRQGSWVNGRFYPRLGEVQRPTTSQAELNSCPTGGTYILRDPVTNQIVRTGRTNNLARRENEHNRDPALGRYNCGIDARTDNYAQQRGREQIIHDTFNPPLNKIQPISPTNPRVLEYLDAAYRLNK